MAVGYAVDLEARRRSEQAATMQVSIGSCRGRVAEGTVTSMLGQRPIPFCGLDQMLLLMEGLLDYGSADGWADLPGRADSRLDGRHGYQNRAEKHLAGEYADPDRADKYPTGISGASDRADKYPTGISGTSDWAGRYPGIDNRPAGKPKIRDFPQNFRIRVYGREHHSLQGELRTGSRSLCFRSGMELVRLIHQELGSRPGGAGQPRQREPSTSQETKGICIYKKREESEL